MIRLLIKLLLWLLVWLLVWLPIKLPIELLIRLLIWLLIWLLIELLIGLLIYEFSNGVKLLDLCVCGLKFVLIWFKIGVESKLEGVGYGEVYSMW